MAELLSPRHLLLLDYLFMMMNHQPTIQWLTINVTWFKHVTNLPNHQKIIQTRHLRTRSFFSMQQTQTKHHRRATVFQKSLSTEKAVIKFCRETENSMQDNIITDCQYLYTLFVYIYVYIYNYLYNSIRNCCMHIQYKDLNVFYKLTFDGRTLENISIKLNCVRTSLIIYWIEFFT